MESTWERYAACMYFRKVLCCNNSKEEVCSCESEASSLLAR